MPQGGGPGPEADTSVGGVRPGGEEAPALCPSLFGWRSGKSQGLETGKKEGNDLEEQMGAREATGTSFHFGMSDG